MDVKELDRSNDNQIKGMDPEKARESLSLMKSILDRHAITFWLSWGTCLGAIREQNFIAHDYDIDLEVHRKDWFKIVKIIPELKAHGFEIKPLASDNFLPNWFSGIHCYYQTIQLDLYVCCKTQKKVDKNLCISGWMSGGNLITKDFFSQLETIDFLGESYNVPQNTRSYLEYLYGSSWQKSQKDFWEYWNSQNQTRAAVDLEVRRENLELIKFVLDKYDIPFWLADQTCLEAMIGNDSLIKSEGISLNTYLVNKEKISNLLPELKQLGFECIRDSSICYTSTLCSLAIKVARRNEFVNIEFAKVAGRYQRLKGNRWLCGTKQFSWNYFEELEPINFLGNSYCVPAHTKRYLCDLYGPVWQNQSSHQIVNSEEQSLALLAKVLKQENQLMLPCREPWMFTWQIHDHLILVGDMFEIKTLATPIFKGMMVLTKTGSIPLKKVRTGTYSGYLSVKRVIETTADGRIRLKSDFYGREDTWCNKSDLIGQVTALHSRFGFIIPFDSKLVQLILPIIAPLLRQLRQVF